MHGYALYIWMLSGRAMCIYIHIYIYIYMHMYIHEYMATLEWCHIHIYVRRFHSSKAGIALFIPIVDQVLRRYEYALLKSMKMNENPEYGKWKRRNWKHMHIDRNGNPMKSIEKHRKINQNQRKPNKIWYHVCMDALREGHAHVFPFFQTSAEGQSFRNLPVYCSLQESPLGTHIFIYTYINIYIYIYIIRRCTSIFS